MVVLFADPTHITNILWVVLLVHNASPYSVRELWSSTNIIEHSMQAPGCVTILPLFIQKGSSEEKLNTLTTVRSCLVVFLVCIDTSMFSILSSQFASPSPPSLPLLLPPDLP